MTIEEIVEREAEAATLVSSIPDQRMYRYTGETTRAACLAVAKAVVEREAEDIAEMVETMIHESTSNAWLGQWIRSLPAHLRKRALSAPRPEGSGT